MTKSTTDTTVAGRITRALAERIISGEFAPGMKLRQDHFAEEFGASHVPVPRYAKLLRCGRPSKFWHFAKLPRI